MSWLILKRRREQSVQIGQDITITVVGIEAGAVILGISAPSGLRITRTVTITPEGQSDDGAEGSMTNDGYSVG